MQRPTLSTGSLGTPYRWVWVALLVALVTLTIVGRSIPDSLANMVIKWRADEYSHSYLVPFLALLLAWQRLPRLNGRPLEPNWIGFLGVLLALGICLLGDLATLFPIVQYGFLLLIPALSICLAGWRNTLTLSPALIYLLFLVPLPNFLYNNLSQSLQLISSALGTSIIRLFDISVHLEGNVIDLGTYQLQVVDACSGLRYLFPLASFGYLVACLWQGPWWQRGLLFVSTAPITVVMNSIRIGVIGVLVEHFGIGMAEGFLHSFEGWVIFLACVAVLLGEITLFNRLGRRAGGALDQLDLSLPSPADIRLLPATRGQAYAPLFASLLCAVAFSLGNSVVERQPEQPPARLPFVQFPLIHQDWLGRDSQLEEAIVNELDVTDYVLTDYRQPGSPLPVNLYIAYYASQRKGEAIHSPRACMPAGGWVIESLDVITPELTIPQHYSGAPPLKVNRTIIRQGKEQQLVYYWFKQRDRLLTNEYLLKWYLFQDALSRNRSDGALIRLIVPVPENVPIDDAEAVLNRFLGDFLPLLNDYVPD